MIDLRIPAISYAGLGWPVFPCRRADKAPATRTGFKDATADVDQVDRAWSGRRHHNIGMPTGVLFDVLDFDRKPPTETHPGVDATGVWQSLAYGGWLDGCVGIAETRNGGRHYYFPASGSRSGSIPLLGVDFKAQGGYVLLPPSRVPADLDDGPGRYRWIRFPDPCIPGIPLEWPQLRAQLDPRPQTQARQYTGTPDPGRRLAGLCRTVSGAIEGNRNRALYWAARELAKDQQLDTHATSELTQAAQAAGLDHDEIRRTLSSAARTAGAI